MRIEHLIGGSFTGGGGEIAVFEPATGLSYASLCDGGSAQIEAAVRAAQQAFPAWARLSSEARAGWLEKLALWIEQRLELFASAESKDTGKPISTARQVDIPRVIQNFRFFASLARCQQSQAVIEGDGIWHTVLQQPLGVVACISPWNLPLYLLSWKLAPALAAGNTVIAKPSEITPMSAHLLAQASLEIGLPPSVLNIVHGRGASAGASLVAHQHVKAVSFTGSTAVGKAIAQATAPMLKKVSLELGGKNASIVFADADLERAVAETVRGGFSNQGQICLCGSRVLVEQSIFADFKARLLAQISELEPADPALDATRFGALTSLAHLHKVERMVERAREEGGRVLLGGARASMQGRLAEGYFYLPTVLDLLPFECATNQEEIFGPVITLIPFENEEQALAMANGTAYGLAASVWTQSLSRAQRMSERLQSGLVWINCWMQRDLRLPFGGVKDSGLGREGGMDAWRFFTESKSVSFGR